MITERGRDVAFERGDQVVAVETPTGTWTVWPVSWSAIWVGALATFAILLVLGLVGIAAGAHAVDRVVDIGKIGKWTVILSVCASFFAFVAGGWIAGRFAGTLRSEPAMLHGGIVWLVAVPILLVAAAFGLGNYLGAWNSGLAGSPAWAPAATAPILRPDLPMVGAAEADIIRYRADLAEYNRKVAEWNEQTPRVARNSAATAVTALLIGLMGAVVGGWLASGEPMSITYYRTRDNRTSRTAVP